MSLTLFQHNHHLYHSCDHHQLSVKQEAPTFVSATTNTTNTKEDTHTAYGRMSPPSLKINKDSHIIKKSPSFSTSTSSPSPPSSTKVHQHQQRGPVIIYTHSPKIIHINPRDFMALVQKLTGMPKANDVVGSPIARDAESNAGFCGPILQKEGFHLRQHQHPHHIQDHKFVKCSGSGVGNNNSISTDDESSSVITDENCSSNSITTGDVVGQLTPCVGLPLFDPPSSLPNLPNLPLFMNSSDVLCSSGDHSIYDYMDFNVPYNQIT